QGQICEPDINFAECGAVTRRVQPPTVTFATFLQVCLGVSMRAAFASFLLLFLAACEAGSGPAAERMVSPLLTSEDARDTLTHARRQIARVKHTALGLALDFEEKEISGRATLDILAQPRADTIVLDSDGLRIAR